MKVISYDDKYKNQIVALILYLQNFENRVDLSLEEQPDMNDINSYYLKDGGGFWLALDDENNLIGTIGLMKKDNNCGILKKFFVLPKYRGKELGISNELFKNLIGYAKQCRIKKIVLDSPFACQRAHVFYKKAGFKHIEKEELPIKYDYPDRNSYLFMKILE